jgi:hypothetical protein
MKYADWKEKLDENNCHFHPQTLLLCGQRDHEFTSQNLMEKALYHCMCIAILWALI